MGTKDHENAIGGAQQGWRATKPDKIAQAEALLEIGASLGSVAFETGLSKTTVHRIKNGIRPRTVDGLVFPVDKAAYPPREEIMAKTNGRCWYCGEDATKSPPDHLVPRCAGGGNELANLLPACWRCNSTKTRLGLEDFRELMAMYAAKWPYFSPPQRIWLRLQGFTPPPFVFFGERQSSAPDSPG